jgi:hypothetical protein
MGLRPLSATCSRAVALGVDVAVDFITQGLIVVLRLGMLLAINELLADAVLG